MAGPPVRRRRGPGAAVAEGVRGGTAQARRQARRRHRALEPRCGGRSGKERCPLAGTGRPDPDAPTTRGDGIMVETLQTLDGK
ncbi:MAG: hypothetical protein MZW92_81965 [Comamonadaceae bacterium]|nr:hypothetical protein [Comamonadaceae bacterium]